MQSTLPLVSVTLPNYNHAHFLVEALSSVLRQTHANLEVLFVDDGSTDDSRDIAAQFAATDPRVKAVYFPSNQGTMAALGSAWSRARGTFIYQFASDDALCDDQFFELGVMALAEDPCAAGFFGIADTVDGATGAKRGSMGGAPHTGFVGPEEFAQGFLRGSVFVPGISSLWRRNRIAEVGGYDAALGPQADYFLNHVLGARHGVVYCSRVFARARVAEGRRSYSASAGADATVARLALFERKMRTAGLPFPGDDSDWNRWRRAQLLALALGDSRLQAIVNAARRSVGGALPAWLLGAMGLVWRHVGRRVLYATTRLGLQYRRLNRKWLSG